MTDANTGGNAPSTPAPAAKPAGKASKYDYTPPANAPTQTAPAQVAANPNTTKPVLQQAAQTAQVAEAKVEQAATTVQKADAKVAKAAEKYKVAVNGQEKEVALEELKNAYSLAEGARQKLQEAATYRKQAEDFISTLRKDPLSVLKNPKLGLDFDKLAKDYLIQQTRVNTMTPEQKAAYEAKQELESYKAREKQQQQIAQQQEIANLTEQYSNHYTQTIPAALQASGIPANRRNVAAVAQYIKEGLARGKVLSPEQVAPRVKQDLMDQILETFGASDGDTLLSLLGEDTAKKIRQSDLKRLKSVAPTPAKTVESKGKNNSSDKKKMGIKQWKKSLDSKEY